jgi:hypothetical protein
MTLEKRISGIFGLHDDRWLNHANPISVWTRFIILPLLVLSIWSRIWINWFSLIPIIIILIWSFINPRIFNKPRTTDSWSAKCVLGERILANRKNIPIPTNHIIAKNILTAIQSAGVIFLIYGLYELHFWATLVGVIVVYLGKMWFLDRMVWLYEDMKETVPEYKSWLY